MLMMLAFLVDQTQQLTSALFQRHWLKTQEEVMNMNTAETLYRLHSLLPLKERQQNLTAEETTIRRAGVRPS